MLQRNSHHRAVVLAALAILMGCARATDGRAPSGAAMQSPSDALFAAAVAALPAEVDIFVDPKPVKLRDEFGYPQAADYFEDADNNVAARLRVLQRIEVDTASILPLPDRCTPLFAPPGTKVVDGCPSTRLVAAFDGVRREAGPPTRYVIRTLWISYDWSGRTATMSDLIFEGTDGRYDLMENRSLMVMH